MTVSYADELRRIAQDVGALAGQFTESRDAMFLSSEKQGIFVRMVTEAKSVLGEALGPANDFTMQLIYTVNNGSGGFYGGPSYACVTETEQLLLGAATTVERRERNRPLQFAKAATRPPYVDPIRIHELQRIQSPVWDYSKLVRLCGELNVAHEHECHHSVAMLVRAILDHVPPLFGFRTFAEVSSNYGAAGTSFKKSMEHLQKTLRNIADSHLHQNIRQKESLPTETQVDFRAALDQLLSEVIRTA